MAKKLWLFGNLFSDREKKSTQKPTVCDFWMDYMEVLVAAPYSGDTVIIDRVIHSESYVPKSSPQTPQDVPLRLWDLSLQVSLDSLAKMLGARFLIP